MLPPPVSASARRRAATLHLSCACPTARQWVPLHPFHHLKSSVCSSHAMGGPAHAGLKAVRTPSCETGLLWQEGDKEGRGSKMELQTHSWLACDLQWVCGRPEAAGRLILAGGALTSFLWSPHSGSCPRCAAAVDATIHELSDFSVNGTKRCNQNGATLTFLQIHQDMNGTGVASAASGDSV